MRKSVVVGLVATAILIGGWWLLTKNYTVSGQVGKNCTVQFRRGDALGAGGSLPVSPTTGNIKGADVSLSGRLVAVDDGWVTVESGSSLYHIPQASILLIRFDKQ